MCGLAWRRLGLHQVYLTKTCHAQMNTSVALNSDMRREVVQCSTVPMTTPYHETDDNDESCLYGIH